MEGPGGFDGTWCAGPGGLDDILDATRKPVVAEVAPGSAPEMARRLERQGVSAIVLGITAPEAAADALDRARAVLSTADVMVFARLDAGASEQVERLVRAGADGIVVDADDPEALCAFAGTWRGVADGRRCWWRWRRGGRMRPGWPLPRRMPSCSPITCAPPRFRRCGPRRSGCCSRSGARGQGSRARLCR